MHLIPLSPTFLKPLFMQDAEKSSSRVPIKALGKSDRSSHSDVCVSSSRLEDEDSTKEVSEELDYSIFEQAYGDAFEPIPFGKKRTRQQEAALNAVLKQSVQFLFPSLDSGDDGASHQSPWDQDSSDDSDTEEPSAKRQRRSLDEYSTLRFRGYQTEAWENRLQDLLQFKEREGHCSVPHSYSENRALARWVKRQRFQYKQRQEGKSSTMTASRVKVLEDIGFVWDSHLAAWEERLSDLRKYRDEHGHCEVPTHFMPNRKLATWVKCQRRQYKLYLAGKPSTINAERVDMLNRLGFSWDMRSSKKDN